jgi:hypothetical protein
MTVDEDTHAAISEEEPEPHDLFLPEKSDDPIIAPSWISIYRQSQPKDSAGRMFAPTEIGSTADIVRRWGGGTYLCIARDSKKKPLKGGSRVYTLAGGPPRIMSIEEPDDPQVLSQGGVPVPHVIVQRSAENDAVNRALDIAKQALDTQRAASEQSAAQAREDRNLLLKVVTDSANNMVATQSEFFKSLAAIHQSQVEKEPPKDSASIYKEGLDAGLAYAQTIKEAGTEESSGGSDLKDLVSGMEALAALKNGGKKPETPPSGGGGSNQGG